MKSASPRLASPRFAPFGFSSVQVVTANAGPQGGAAGVCANLTSLAFRVLLSIAQVPEGNTFGQQADLIWSRTGHASQWKR
jgi:hypothetical protein